MHLPKPRPLPVAIPTILLADLVLLAVLVFVFTTTDDAAGAPTGLPTVAASTVAELGSARAVLERRVDAGGMVRWRWRFSDGIAPASEAESADALFGPASVVASRDPDRTFVVKADADARWADVDRTVEVLRAAGARNVVFWTREPIAEGSR